MRINPTRRLFEAEDLTPGISAETPAPVPDPVPVPVPAPDPGPAPVPVIEAAAAVAMKACPFCKEKIPADATTCPECKMKMKAPGQKEGTDLSLDEVQSAVTKALQTKFPAKVSAGNSYPSDVWPRVVYTDSVIYGIDGKFYQAAYTWDLDGNVVLGDSVEVRQEWERVKEGMVLGPLTDDGRLVEAGQAASGKKWGVLLIQEGMSKNRNRYGRKCLEAAAPLYEAAKIYMDHEETPRRFGRSTRDVAGFVKDVQPVLIGTRESAGGTLALAATAVILNPVVQTMLLDAYTEGNPNLFGLSHDVKAESVTAVGPDGPFYEVTRIESVASVDFVTNPAAGGRLVRLVASDSTPDTLIRDGNMLKKLIEAIMASGNAELIAKLAALGDSPNEDQVIAIHREALTSKPAPVAAPVKEAVIQDGPKVVQVNEADWFEVRKDGIALFLENTLGGVTLPDPVKASIRKRFTENLAAGTFPTKDAILAAVKDQSDIFAALADKGFVMPGQRIQVGAGPVEKTQEAMDAFFDPSKNATSLRELYIGVTGDTKITGRTADAPRLREALNTGSWTQILGDSITRRMVAEYAVSPLTNWRGVIAEVVPVADFRTQRRMRFGGYGNLPVVGQGAPYTALTSPTDEEATYAPVKRGGTESVTIEMIANDDVGSVRRIPSKLARSAAQTLHEFAWDFLNTNALIYDGAALAVGGHFNITAVALTSAQLAAARLMLKQQTDMSSGVRLGLAARTLIVPTDLEELAYILTQSPQAIPIANVTTTAAPAAKNFIATQGIKVVVVDYWTDATNFWVVADPSQSPMIEIGFLSGREEPELFVQDTPNQGSLFSNDQITYKIRHVYGGAVLDFRPFVGGINP
jgi:RNA polymerase subunit RPABC4/transcription elongation factor Spt4